MSGRPSPRPRGPTGSAPGRYQTPLIPSNPLKFAKLFSAGYRLGSLQSPQVPSVISEGEWLSELGAEFGGKGVSRSFEEVGAKGSKGGRIRPFCNEAHSLFEKFEKGSNSFISILLCIENVKICSYVIAILQYCVLLMVFIFGGFLFPLTYSDVISWA